MNFGATDRNVFTGDTQDILPGSDTPGAIVAGLLIGEIVSLTTFFAPKLAEIVVFVVMAVVLLVRPSGLFGEAGLAE